MRFVQFACSFKYAFAIFCVVSAFAVDMAFRRFWGDKLALGAFGLAIFTAALTGPGPAVFATIVSLFGFLILTDNQGAPATWAVLLAAEGAGVGVLTYGLRRGRVVKRQPEVGPHEFSPVRGGHASGQDDRLRQVADAVPHIAWIADEHGELTYLNTHWRNYTGQLATPAAAGFFDSIHADERVAAAQGWRRAAGSDEPWDAEYRFRRADGAYRSCHCRAIPIRDADGGVARWFGTATDIDEVKQLQWQRNALLVSERAARDQAEQAARLKDDLLSTLSHELRTPLNAISGWTRLLKKSGPANAQQSEALGVIERNAGAQTRIIEDLLDMSRIMNGKIQLQMQEFDPATAVRQAVETLRPASAAKSIRVIEHFDAAGGRVRGDATRLQQVVWNLLSNAIKFTPQGGEVHVSLTRSGAQVKISVSDNGTGIAASFLPHLFERFRQQDPSTTREHGGLGLGLAVVKQIVGMHGGSVSAASDGPGRGATLTVSLPAAELTAGPAAVADGAGSPGQAAERPADVALHQARILVVDDQSDARAFMKRLLEEHGAHVTVAGSAREALELLAHQPMDILVSDIGMPGEDGYALIRHVRELPEPGNMILAIAVTAYAQDKDRAKALDSGFQVHLAKPIEPADLLNVLSILLPQQAA